jgi:hypothetical protein
LGLKIKPKSNLPTTWICVIYLWVSSTQAFTPTSSRHSDYSLVKEHLLKRPLAAFATRVVSRISRPAFVAVVSGERDITVFRVGVNRSFRFFYYRLNDSLTQVQLDSASVASLKPSSLRGVSTTLRPQTHLREGSSLDVKNTRRPKSTKNRPIVVLRQFTYTAADWRRVLN